MLRILEVKVTGAGFVIKSVRKRILSSITAVVAVMPSEHRLCLNVVGYVSNGVVNARGYDLGIGKSMLFSWR